MGVSKLSGDFPPGVNLSFKVHHHCPSKLPVSARPCAVKTNLFVGCTYFYTALSVTDLKHSEMLVLVSDVLTTDQGPVT